MLAAPTRNRRVCWSSQATDISRCLKLPLRFIAPVFGWVVWLVSNCSGMESAAAKVWFYPVQVMSPVFVNRVTVRRLTRVLTCIVILCLVITGHVLVSYKVHQKGTLLKAGVYGSNKAVYQIAPTNGYLVNWIPYTANFDYISAKQGKETIMEQAEYSDLPPKPIYVSELA